MAIKSISFKNYKAFSEEQELEIKPITILIGKNSSGKSSIAKLFTLLENSLSGRFEEPLRISNDDVILGGDFRDLVFNRLPSSPIYFSVSLADNSKLSVEILKESETSPTIRIYSWSFNSIYFEYSKDAKCYLDKHGAKYSIEFRGFIPQYIRNEEGIDKLSEYSFQSINLNVDYIGPFRILPNRIFNLTGQMQFTKTGIKGQNAYEMLGISKLLNNELHNKVAEWYKQHFDGWRLEVSSKNDPYIEINLKKGSSEVNIVDVGQGMNQALPLIVRANLKVDDSIIVIEQPELHLHPAAHGDLAELFARSAKENSQFYIIETHSENILLRLRALVVENDFGFSNTDVNIYWINSDNEQNIQKIIIDENGTLSDWPEGVFTESIAEIENMRNSLRKKHGS